MQQDDVAVRKRVQIAETNKTMFIWIAVVSALVGFSLVASVFLVQQLIYNEKVLSKKQETVRTLNQNLAAVDDLKQEIRKLDVNEALLSARADDEHQAVQVILDALPSEANSFALGASLQNRLLPLGGSDITLESLQVTPVQGIEVFSEAGGDDIAGSSDVADPIQFNFVINGTESKLRQTLQNLEKSIRTINVTSLRITGQSGNRQQMSVQGTAYYKPSVNLEFKEEAV